MATPTPEELDKLRADNESLREKIAAAKSTQAQREADLGREIEFQNLTAENTRLQAELAQATEAAKVGAVKDGASTVLDAAKDQIAQAQALAAATPGPVDTNATDEKNGGSN